MGVMLLGFGCAEKTSTTFTFLYPTTERRNVELEINEGRRALAFGAGDSLLRAIVTLPLVGGAYARLWVGGVPYTVWMEAGKQWTAEFKWNEWRFTGEGAAENAYLNGHYRNQVLFMDYYRIPNRAFREKLERMMVEREDSLRVAALDEPFAGLERKRLRYMRNLHIASGVVYGEPVDRPDTVAGTMAELRCAAAEDVDSWAIPEYRESIYRTLSALARLEGENWTVREQALDVLRAATRDYRDERLVAYLVERKVMEYVKNVDLGDMTEMDAAFWRWVMDSVAMAEYEAITAKARALAKGQPAADFAFVDMEGDTVRLSDFRGRYVYVDLWATWCGPCNAEIPHLKRLEERMRGRNIAFVGMSSDRDREAWASFVRERGLGGTQLFMGGDDSFLRAVHCEGIPRFLLIDPEGNYVNADMTRPSNPATLATLEALPGI